MTTNPENLAGRKSRPQSNPVFKDRVEALYQALAKLSWQHWAAVAILVSGGIGFTATSVLLKLPATPQCARIFWPIASASMRLYCADMAAERGTVESLLEAIDLVESLPADHPLRAQIDRKVEQWAAEILALAEEEFQVGKLEGAIAIARQIPSHVQAFNLVEDQIERWQSIWQEGETIAAEVERQLRDSNWTQAFREAVKLLNLDNQYWATVKYNQISRQVQLAREESSKLDNAYAVLRRGGLDNWLQAIAEAEKIPSSSYAYQEAQNLIAKAKDQLLGYGKDLIAGRQWQALLELVDRVPESLALNAEVEGWNALASAGLAAEEGTVESLQAAIAALGQVASSSPLYAEAQELSDRWQLEIQGVTYLSRASDLAQGGTVESLNAAIAEAQLVGQSNPRYREAQGQIRDWRRQIETIEDQPLLDRARDIASSGSLTALQEAIAEASSILPGRALSGEAQEEIGRWRSSIQRQEDRPLLDRAVALAGARDYQAAIDAAAQIGRGRVLYGEARGNIRRWQQEVRAQKALQEAYLVSQPKTPEALIAAIKILQKIPAATEVKFQSLQALNNWSYQLLSMAQELAGASSYREAIRLARTIPQESDAYTPAREQISTWQQMLLPPPPPAPPPSILETNYSGSRSPTR